MSGVEAPEHFGKDPDASEVRTDRFLLTERALTDIVSCSAIGAFVGVAGTGKTFALRALTRDLSDVETVWVEFESRPTMLHVARVISLALIGEQPRGNRNQLSMAILDELTDGRRASQLLLVVDEAQRLNTECIEYLRYLHDHVATGFALALCGGNGCWSVISAEPMLSSRIFRRVSFKPMREAELIARLPEYHPIYGDCDPELILTIDGLYARGLFRHWAGFTATAASLMRERKQGALDEETARLAIELLGED